MPKLLIVAGPNGSGKTSLTKRFFSPLGIAEDTIIVNPDVFARDLVDSAADMEKVRLIAARKALKMHKNLIANKTDFIVETTMAGQSPLNLMKNAKSAGYEILLLYVCLDNPLKSVERVRQRVNLGGHHVPEDEIKRRYKRSLENLPQVICGTDFGFIMDNSSTLASLVAEVKSGTVIVHNSCKWFEEALADIDKSSRALYSPI